MLSAALLGGCRAPRPRPAGPDLAGRAAALAERLILVDTHIDVPYRIRGEGMQDLSRSGPLDFDYPRARRGGLDAAFFSIYIPATYQERGGARALADELIDLAATLVAQGSRVALARSPADVRRHAREGKLSVALGMENGAGLEDDLANLAHFHRRGVRYVTLTHAENNLIGDSSYARERRWHGLSPYGRGVVEEMNRLGMMVDVSHVSDETFDEVLAASRAPVIASHSSCRRFTPGWERNLGDDMILRLAAAGGVVQINFGSSFLTAAAQKQSEAAWEEQRAWLAERGLAEDSREATEFWDRYWEGKEKIFADVSDVADHIDHVVRLAGVEHVGLGSDFDGVGDSLPTGLKDVSQYPNLIAELLRRGYREREIRKIAGENLLRVWAQVEKVAARRAPAPVHRGRSDAAAAGPPTPGPDGGRYGGARPAPIIEREG